MAMSSTLALALVLSARTGAASKAIDQFASKTANKLAEMAAKSEELMRRGFADLEVGKAIMRPVQGLVDAAVSFQDKMADVAKFTNDKIGSEGFKKLSQQALEVSKKMGIPAEEAAESMAQLAASGTPIEKLKDMAIKAAIMGKAFDISAGQAADGYKSIQAALGATDSRMDVLMDATNALTNAYGKGTDAAAQLFEFMQDRGAAAARTMQVNERYVAAMGNTMRDFGTKTEVAGRAVRKLSTIIYSDKGLKKMMEDAGGGEAGINAILSAANKSKNAIEWFKSHGAGDFSGQLGTLAATLNGEKGFNNQLAVATENNSGSVQQEADNRMSTQAEKLKQFNSALEAMQITAGQTLLPALEDLTKAISPFIDKLSDFLKENPKVTKTFLSMALALGGLKVAGGVGKILKGSFITPIAKGFGFFAKGKDGISKFSKSLETVKKVSGKAGSAVSNMAFKARFYSEAYGRKAVKATGQFVKAAGSGIGKAAVSGAKAVGSGAAKAFEATKTGMQTFGKVAKSGVIKGIQGIGKAFSFVGKLMMANPWLIAIMAIAAAVYLVIKYWKPIKAFFIRLWDWVKGIFSKAWQWIKEMFLNYTPYGLIIKHWEGISDFFVGLWDKIKNAFSAALDWIKEKWQNMKSWLIDKLFNNPVGRFLIKATGKLVGIDSSEVDKAMNAYFNPDKNQKLAPKTQNNTNTNVTFNLTGGASREDIDKTFKLFKKHFPNLMENYQHNRNRTGFGNLNPGY